MKNVRKKLIYGAAICVLFLLSAIIIWNIKGSLYRHGSIEVSVQTDVMDFSQAKLYYNTVYEFIPNQFVVAENTPPEYLVVRFSVSH